MKMFIMAVVYKKYVHDNHKVYQVLCVTALETGAAMMLYVFCCCY